MKSTTKVWHVFGTMDIGGAELRTLELADAIAPHGVRFEYVTLSGSAGVLDDRIRASGSRIHPMALGVSFPLRFYIALRNQRPDALDSHVATFSGLLVLIAWLARVPVRVAHFRSDGDGHADTVRRRVQRGAMVWLIDRFATHIVGVSPSSLTDGFRRDWARDERASVVPNGLPSGTPTPTPKLRRDLGLAPGDLLLMHVGRPSPEKNRPLAVRVLHALVEAGHDAHLALVGGDGVDTEAVTEAIDSLEVHRYVHHLGKRDDVRSLMAEADVVLLTSVREGLPGVVLESLSVGTPVVSTPLPGVAFIAEAVAGVETVDAGELNTWVKAVRRAGVAGGEHQRARVCQSFREGPFSLERSTLSHLRIYRGTFAR